MDAAGVLSGDGAVLYVGSAVEGIYALDTVKGTVKWTYIIGRFVSWEQLWA